jgi:uncharacterized RDD family membrane protein YckC
MSTDPSLLVPLPINDQPQALPFGPVWRRVVAYIADSLLLSVAGAGIGAAFSNKLWGLGPWGRLIGFFVASIYFVSLDSGVGSGQTLGKRWMKLRVVNAAGNCISPGQAFARFAIFTIPYSLYNLTLPLTRTPWIVFSLISFIVLWDGGLTWLLIVFNTPSRQGPHDLAVQSYVVYYDHSGPVNAQYMHRFLVPVLGGLLVVITVASAAARNWSERQPSNIEFHRDSRPIEVMDGVQRARLWDSLSHSPGGGPAKKILHVYIVLKSKPVSEEAFADEAARAILHEDRNALEYDELSVRLSYVYDIGIASHWDHRDFEHTPVEWQQRLGGVSEAQP